ncbi:hypothetical protein EVAR_88418_1 [Eumeta japonica]|uniref:Uncharacterized protein n=1 Tax=Eumeta variegata TaxID=151549 RepID=A0A4C1Y0W3_EUMVA|nr:hypothetical protein EVAR_88418_1 [Eumeta japonica]
MHLIVNYINYSEEQRKTQFHKASYYAGARAAAALLRAKAATEEIFQIDQGNHPLPLHHRPDEQLGRESQKFTCQPRRRRAAGGPRRAAVACLPAPRVPVPRPAPAPAHS